MKVLRYDGTTAVVEIYLASGVVSKDVVPQLAERFELMLAESETNMFLKKICRRGDYYALIAIESGSLKEAALIASSLEARTRKVSSQVKSSVISAINRMG
jgi:hypothetical protein